MIVPALQFVKQFILNLGLREVMCTSPLQNVHFINNPASISKFARWKIFSLAPRKDIAYDIGYILTPFSCVKQR